MISSPAQPRRDPEETGATVATSGPSDQPATDGQPDEERRKRRMEQSRRFDELNRSAARSIRSICTGC